MGISTNSSELKAHIHKQHIEFPIVPIPADARILTQMGPTPTTFVVNLKGVIEKMWVGVYVNSARLEIEPYFGVSLPSLASGAQSGTAVPARATPRQ